MNIEAFLLCDAATDTQGKLNVLGAFDHIFSPQTPTIYPSCTVAARIRFTKVEEGKHKVRLNIIDSDGKSVVPPLDGAIEVRIPDNTDSTVANLILNLQNVKLNKFGEYRIDLAIDGRQEGSLPFNLREVKQAPPPAPK